ncbi:MAG TPA: alpha/beta fold hydrolase [Acidimicrobiales bacterium]|nr:alpha/beta fold hydrolase [Acidimicrobiales bacterium]
MTAASTSCVNHRRRPRVATCGACGNAICSECIVHTGVGVKCRTCTGVKAAKAPKAGQVHVDAAPKASASRSGRKPWAVPVAIGGVVVLAAAAFGLASRDSGSTVTEDVTLAGPATGWTERQTEFVGAGGQRIGGTLTIPALEEGRVAPAVLIIPGLGALDRNGPTSADPPDALRDALVTGVTGLGVTVPNPLYQDLSESLAREGIASFRYDKRGTKPSALREGQKLSFDDEVTDARAALDLLSKRQEVGAAPIVLLGHDTGGVVAMRLSAGNGRVRGVVAISTPARRMDEVLAADMTRSRGAEVGDAFRAAASTVISTGKAPPAGALPEFIRPIFASGQDAYLAIVLALDPVAEVGNVPVQVLLVRGGADPTIAAADVTKMQSSLRIGGQVMVASSQADRNLAFASAGHEHSSSAAAPTIQRDADARTALAGWVKVQLSS